MNSTICKPKVLFLDLENCAGSQMAEAYLSYLAGDLFEAFSAGKEVHESSAAAVPVMDEVDLMEFLYYGE
jgi:protein-tyrosine-phosphatase